MRAPEYSSPTLIPLKDNLPAVRPPLMTIAVIVACVVVYVSGWDPNLDQMAWPVAAVASIFVAGGLIELLVNSLAIWLFAKSLEDRLGRARLLVFFLLAGIAAAAVRDLLESGAGTPAAGAGGAVAGLIGAYLVLFIRARILCFVLIPFLVTMVEVPALVIAAVWVALQALEPVGQPTVSELLGGALFGVAAIKLGSRGRPGATAEPSRPVY